MHRRAFLQGAAVIGLGAVTDARVFAQSFPAGVIRTVATMVLGGFQLSLGSRLVGTHQPRDWLRAIPGLVLMALGALLAFVAFFSSR